MRRKDVRGGWERHDQKMAQVEPFHCRGRRFVSHCDNDAKHREFFQQVCLLMKLNDDVRRTVEVKCLLTA